MTIRYCEKCGVLMHVKVIPEHSICADCAAGKRPRFRGPRDSSMIPRKKIEALKNLDIKKSKG